jgi:hypothetical protein
MGIAVDYSGNVFVADYNGNTIRQITTAGVGITLAGSNLSGYVNGQGDVARFDSPAALAIDPSASICVADSGNNVIRVIR